MDKNRKTNKNRVNVRFLKTGKVFSHKSTLPLSLSKSTWKPLRQWVNTMTGVPAFLIGNAPSLNRVDLSILDPYFTIGLNRIYQIYDPTILMWQDIQILQEGKNKILEQKSIPVSATKSDPTRMFLNYEVLKGNFGIPVNIEKLQGMGNSGALSAQLAIKMGCSSLILLGMDCKYEGEKTDFYGKNKDHRGFTLRMCWKAMTWLVKNSPIPVFNCGEGDFLEKRKLEDVIEELKPEKLGREYFLEKLRNKL